MPAQYDKPLDLIQYPPKQFYYWQEEGEKWYKDVFPLRKMGRNDFFFIDDPKDVPRVRSAITLYKEDEAPWALFTVRKLSKYSDTYVCRRLSG